MRTRIFRFWLIFLCGAYGMVLYLQQHIILYINQSYVVFFLCGSIVCVIIGAAGMLLSFLWKAEHESPSSPVNLLTSCLLYIPFMVFLIAGIVLPPQPLSTHVQTAPVSLGTNTIASSDIDIAIRTAASNTNENDVFTRGSMIPDSHVYQLYGQDTKSYSYQYWYLINGLKPSFEVDKWAHLTGMVVRQQDTPPDEFYLTRYLITCCVADAIPIAFLAEYNLASGNTDPFVDNTWVDLVGQFQKTDNQIIFYPQSGQTIPPPADPYIN